MLPNILEIITVSLIGLKNLRFRVKSSFVAVVGFAGVVAVFVAVLALQRGFDAVTKTTGSDDVAIVVHTGATTELNSVLTYDDIAKINNAPGIKKVNDAPLVSAEMYVVVNVPKRGRLEDANVPFRGVDARSFEIRENVHITQGRALKPGLNELIVGKKASSIFQNLEVGDEVHWGASDWKVVGIFEANGSMLESEIWGDVKVLQTAYNRGNTYQAVYAKLDSPQSLDEFSKYLKSDGSLLVDVKRESDFYRSQTEFQSKFIFTVGTLIAALMGIGAIFGAVNTMYSTVSSRAKEIAVLRTIGFSRLSVYLSVISEGLLLGLIGGLFGALIAYVAVNGYQISTMGFESFSQVVFEFKVTLPLLVTGIQFALVMGLIGGLLPAIRATRVSLANSLRDL